MVYLMESAAYKKDDNENIKLFLILKIGFTGDDKSNKRFSDFLTQNPTCKILNIIPEGTIEHENKIQKLFEPLIISGNELGGINTKEWYWHSKIIIEFFSDLKTVDDLEKKLKTYPNPINDIILNQDDINNILSIANTIIELENLDINKNQLQSFQADKITKDKNIYDFYDLLDLLELEKSGIKGKIIKYLELQAEVLDVLDKISKSNKDTSNNLKILYDNLSEDLIPQALEFLPNYYSNHYYLIGKNQILEDSIENKKQRMLENFLLDKLVVGKEYSIEEIKFILEEGYNLIGDKLEKDKRPIKNIIKEFFYIKENNKNSKLLLL